MSNTLIEDDYDDDNDRGKHKRKLEERNGTFVP